MRPLVAHIDLAALEHNFSVACSLATKQAGAPTKMVAVIKANAYGHGSVACAQQLESKADLLALASIEEALELRHHGVTARLLVLSGAFEAAEVSIAAQHNITLVLHHAHQIPWLQSRNTPCNYWVKLDTGMNRLGFNEPDIALLLELPNAGYPPVVMHHYACADNPDHPLNNTQHQRFTQYTSQHKVATSCANSAILCGQRFPVGDYARPGIMLYGSSPIHTHSASELGLVPVMSFESKLISCKAVRQGDAVGYGSNFTAPEDGYIGIAPGGYADGYPRDFLPGAQPWVSIDSQRIPIAGRVSMDNLCLWLGTSPRLIGSRVVFWGDAPTIDLVAAWSGTIANRILTGVSQRVKREYYTSQRATLTQAG